MQLLGALGLGRRQILGFAEVVVEGRDLEAAAQLDGGVDLEAGADDVISNDDGSFDVITPWEDFSAIKEALIAAGHAPEAGEVGELLQDEDGAAEVEQIDLGRHAVKWD